MANLVITIIGIVLTAVIAIVGVLYMGSAFESAQGTELANTLLNETHQLYAAATAYGLDHGLQNFGADFAIGTIYSTKNYLQGVASGGTALSMAGVPMTNTLGLGADNTCGGLLDGEPVVMERGICQINAKNVINYYMRDSISNPGTCNGINLDASSTGNAKLPVVQMALAINAKLSLPSGLTYAPSGLPYALDGVLSNCQDSPAGGANYDNRYFNGTEKFNYCYLDGTSGTVYQITCSFLS